MDLYGKNIIGLSFSITISLELYMSNVVFANRYINKVNIRKDVVL